MLRIRDRLNRILTDEQAAVLKAAIHGHNLFLSGQAGTGKSDLVKEIYRNVSAKGKNVSIVCSSATAGSVYDELNARVSTVHSHYGLGTAELRANLVVNRSLSNNLVCERVKGEDVIIWDEISMASRRLLDIANLLNCKLAPDAKSARCPFGGKQTILVGELVQLPPASDFLDVG